MTSTAASSGDALPVLTAEEQPGIEAAAATPTRSPEIVAIENITPYRLDIQGHGAMLVLSPLERRPVAPGELEPFALGAGQLPRLVRPIYRRSRQDDFLDSAMGFFILAVIAYLVVGGVLSGEVSRFWLWTYWIGTLAVAAIVIAGVLLWASGRGATALATLGHQAALFFAVVSGIGLPLGALYLMGDIESLWTGDGIGDEERLGRTLQLAFVALVSLVPALFYYIFDRERVGTVRDAFFRSIFSLDPDIENLRDAEAKYGARAEELFGRPDETRSGRIVRGKRLPILIATLLITLGWVMTLVATNAGTENQPLLSYFEPRQHPIAFAFLGAYFFTLTTLVRRYSQGDLTAKAYGQVVARIVLATILSWVVMVSLSTEADWPALLVLAFMVGVFPESGILFVRESLPASVRKLFPPLEEKMPLTDLEGIDFYDRVRLAEEGVNNVQALVRHDLVSLMLRTRIPVSRLVDWADQAILYLHLDPGGTAAPGTDRAVLRQFGIRTATDLLAVATSGPAGGDDPLDVIAAGNAERRARLRLICESIRGEPLFWAVQHWRTSCNAAHSPIRVRPDGTVLSTT